MIRRLNRPLVGRAMMLALIHAEPGQSRTAQTVAATDAVSDAAAPACPKMTPAFVQ
jgi:hypothetical protein